MGGALLLLLLMGVPRLVLGVGVAAGVPLDPLAWVCGWD